jgi:beta-glucanase (GH16 family)
VRNEPIRIHSTAKRRAAVGRRAPIVAVCGTIAVFAVVVGLAGRNQLIQHSGPPSGALAVSTPLKVVDTGPGSTPPAAPHGYKLAYVQQFNGARLPSGWRAWSGEPGNDQYGWWQPANLTVSGGALHFGTSWDAAKGIYSSAGTGFFGNQQIYGEYLVRMEGDPDTNLEFSDIFLLWPVANVWPPEMDVYEDNGKGRHFDTATLHPGPNGDDVDQIENQVQNSGTVWHTYGVIWTPTTLTYTIDGKRWAIVRRSELAPGTSWPDQPFTLDLQSQNLGPRQPSAAIETMTVDWVEIFKPTS